MFAYEKPKLKKAFKSTVQKKENKKPVAKPSLTGIPDDMKSRFENFSGLSFDDVRVHYNSDKPAQLQALAYTQGNQVYVGAGQEKHLSHELGHVVQQKQNNVSATRTINGTAINDDPKLENEAETYGVIQKMHKQVIAHNISNAVVQRVPVLQINDDSGNPMEDDDITEMFTNGRVLPIRAHIRDERRVVDGTPQLLTMLEYSISGQRVFIHIHTAESTYFGHIIPQAGNPRLRLNPTECKQILLNAEVSGIVINYSDAGGAQDWETGEYGHGG